MMTVATARLACVSLLTLPSLAAADGPQFTDWSDPVHLGPVVNSSSQDFSPQLSPDGLSLYFSSDRPDSGFGGFDIWVTHRECESCPWEPPVPLGPNVNSAGDELSTAFSPSGHLLFFASDRPEADGFGDTDIWVSFRLNRQDDFGWSRPINLGPHVNTDQHEIAPAFLPGRFWLGGHTLFFTRSTETDQDIFEVNVSPLGFVRGPAVPVTEINAIGANDGDPSLRRDGLEIVFWSDRVPGRIGGADIWSATRPHVRAPWSPPVNLGPPVNTVFAEISVGMTFDGTQLFMAKGQQLGGLGLRDLWISTRERIDDDQEDDWEDND
jgi:hypothetical protein